MSDAKLRLCLYGGIGRDPRMKPLFE